MNKRFGKIEMSAAEFDRSQLDPKEIIEVFTVDDPEFARFTQTNPNGLAIVLMRETQVSGRLRAVSAPVARS